MRFKFSLILLFSVVTFGFAQEKSSEQPFDYLNIKQELDMIVDYTMVNPECATKKQNFYSVIIGTTVIGEFIERISVLVPCLENEFIQGDFITVKPIKTPTNNIIYITRNYEKDGQQITDVFGSEFRAIWAEVVK